MPDVRPRPPTLVPAFEPLPAVRRRARSSGLLEYLDARGGQEDLFRIAADTNREFGKLIAVVKAAELLDLVDTPKRMVVLSPQGVQLVRAPAAERQALWREHLLRLRLFQVVRDALSRQESHQLPGDFVLETVAVNMPNEDYESMFETFVNWARFGDVLEYDEATDTLTLPTVP